MVFAFTSQRDTKGWREIGQKVTRPTPDEKSSAPLRNFPRANYGGRWVSRSIPNVLKLLERNGWWRKGTIDSRSRAGDKDPTIVSIRKLSTLLEQCKFPKPVLNVPSHDYWPILLEHLRTLAFIRSRRDFTRVSYEFLEPPHV